MHAVLFGSEQGEYLAMRFEQPEPEKQGWIEAEITVAVEAFRGSIEIIFEYVDIAEFERQLRRVYDTLNGRAVFKHRDGQLMFSVEGNGRGGIALSGYAYARPTWGNKLEFEIAFDQTYLLQPLAVLQTLAQQ